MRLWKSKAVVELMAAVTEVKVPRVVMGSMVAGTEIMILCVGCSSRDNSARGGF